MRRFRDVKVSRRMQLAMNKEANGCMAGETAWQHTPASGIILRGCKREGTSRHLGVFVHGFGSHSDGGKARRLAAMAGRNGYSWLRFDQRGCGMSAGRFREFTISGAIDDTCSALAALGNPPSILVGSSLGALIALHVARSGRHRIDGMVLIAPAVRFVERFLHRQVDEREMAQWRRRGYRWFPDLYAGGCYRLDYAFCADALRYAEPPGELPCPVRVIHGARDELLPLGDTEEWLAGLDCPSKGLEIIERGDHRLTQWSDDIARLTETLFNEVRDSCA